MDLSTLTEDQRAVLRQPQVDVEKLALRLALAECGTMIEVAHRLKIGRSTLYRKLGDYGLTPIGGRRADALALALSKAATQAVEEKRFGGTHVPVTS